MRSLTGRVGVAAIGAAAFLLSARSGPPAPPGVLPLEDFFAARAEAQPAPAAPGGDVVVARVGESVITARELEQRIAETPRSTLAKMGSTPDEIKRAFLENALIRDALLAEEARARGLDKRKDVRDRILGVLRAALIDGIKREKGQVTDDEVKAYYDANRDKFSAPKRVGIHRILVATKEEADEIIAEVGAVPDPKKWNEVAREKSLDKSTHLRGGNLGLLAEDGSGSQHDTKYDSALVKAADQVKDGELVPAPVREGNKWAVVWKRQSMRAMSRPLELEAPAIRAALVDQKIRAAIQDVLKELRPAHVKESNPELCDMITVDAQGELEKARRPGVLPKSKRPASPVPP